MTIYTLTNKTRRNLVVNVARGKRITLLPEIPVKVEGDFQAHNWVTRGWMTAEVHPADVPEPEKEQQEPDRPPEIPEEAPAETDETEGRQETSSRQSSGRSGRNR